MAFRFAQDTLYSSSSLAQGRQARLWLEITLGRARIFKLKSLILLKLRLGHKPLLSKPFLNLEITSQGFFLLSDKPLIRRSYAKLSFSDIPHSNRPKNCQNN